LNNTLSNAPIGIYFKLPHSATSSSQTALEVAGNKFSSTGRASIENNTAYVNIHDNAFGGGSTYINLGEDFRGDSNIIAHNTFLDGSVNVLATTATNNTIANNIIMKSLIVLRYVSTSISTTLQRNLYTSSSSLLSMTTKMESTALVGTPMFVGGANPSTLPQYALASTSIGRAAATDGTDIGLRVTSTSSSPTAPATTSPPSAPSLSVQIQ
jgi:hypothetical protein